MTQPPPPCEGHHVLDRDSGEEEESAEEELRRLRSLLAEQEEQLAGLGGELARGAARVGDLERQVVSWREKYDRLYDSHKRVQRVNQGLEDKLLQMAERCSSEKGQLARDVETLSLRLAEANHSMGGLHKENERYKNDMNLAIRLLQCKPDNFVSQKFDTLPIETQARVSSYIMSKAKQSHEPTPSTPKSPATPEKIDPDEFEFNISASLMSKILEESVQNTVSKHCNTCTCPKKSANPFTYGETRYTVSTQTALSQEVPCDKCTPLPSVASPLSPPPEVILPSPPTSIIETSTNHIIEIDKESTMDIKNILKPNEENSNLVSLKHKEIMEKIGENLNEMNLKNEFQIPTIEPSGHHRLCDRTKPASSSTKSPVEYYYPKPEDGGTERIDLEVCKPVAPSPNLVSTIQMAEDLDITFAQIENPVAIPNIAECKINYGPKTKADLNYIETPNNFRNNSISSNEAESKTSSSRSWKNNGSHNSSNAKVHIGPGPRFCSLRMQAGSKNILLDNAQPNIAPVLYTRQSRNLDTSPSTIGALCEDDLALSPPEKRDRAPVPYGPSFVGSTVTNVFSNTSVTEEIAILDLPNEELPLRPIEICEKPESGYKSNESAEIIDKLLFGVDPTIPVTAVNVTSLQREPSLKVFPEISKINVCNSSEPNEIKINIDSPQIKDEAQKADPFQRERRVSINNMKVFNFDQYERNLKIQPMGKMLKDKMMPPPFGTYGSAKVPGTARQVITDLDDLSKDVAQVIGGDLNKMLDKTVNQFTKKLVRNIANQTLPENLNLTAELSKDWKKESCTEKSSSSLSSDDSAAVLQKQQLLRVAQWVQQNLELERQEPAEEQHHARNDFPRPAKVEHARRRSAHRRHAPTRPEDAPLSREELARMEYNVKQFLLNGSRWTDSPTDLRTASKTETDL